MEKGAGYTGQESLPFFLLLSLYCCCLNIRGRAEGKAGVQTALTASLPRPLLLTCKEILKQYIWSLLVNVFLSLALQPLKGWDLAESLSSPVLPSMHILPSASPSQGCTPSSSQANCKRSFGVAWVGFGEQAACHKLAVTPGAHGPEQTRRWRIACSRCGWGNMPTLFQQRCAARYLRVLLCECPGNIFLMLHQCNLCLQMEAFLLKAWIQWLFWWIFLHLRIAPLRKWVQLYINWA